MPEAMSAITTRKLPRSQHAACMSKKMPHLGDMFEVELPPLGNLLNRRAILFLCQNCLADLIVCCAVNYDVEA